MKKGYFLLVCVLLISLGVWTVACAQEQAPSELRLAIRNVELCSAVNTETGDHTVQPGATFKHGDVVWPYFEVYGMTTKRIDGKFECWPSFSELKLFEPSGARIMHSVDVMEFHYTDLAEPPPYLFFYAWLESTTDDPTGQYKWEFTVKDKLSEATGTGSATFTLK